MELTESFEWEGPTIACGRAGTGPAAVLRPDRRLEHHPADGSAA